MASDPSNEPLANDRSEPPAPVGRGLLFAGVAAACTLGVAAGMWARPADGERRAAPVMRARTVASAKPTSSLQIVVDDRPAPLGQPLEVMPAASAPPPGAAPSTPQAVILDPPPPAYEMAPTRSPIGLVRVQAIAAPPIDEPAPSPTVSAAPTPAKAMVKATPDAKPAAIKIAAPAPKPAPKPAPVKAAPVKIVQVKAARPAAAAPKAKLVKAKAVAAAPKAKVAKAPAVKEPARKAAARLVIAERKAKPRLAAMVRTLTKTSARKAEKPAARAVAPPAAKPARARPLKAGRLQLAAARTPPRANAVALRAPRLETAVLRRPAAAPKPAPIKVARVASRCASADPGATVVCKDPALGAADRELGRAYRQAEAAGVPSSRLAQQQQRWLAARATAAKEAPWAVRDVYQARIAELHDMARSAGSNE